MKMILSTWRLFLTAINKCAIVAALPAEAKPLIDHYRLKKNQAPHPFQLWHGENIDVIISGIGKVFAAAAVSYLFSIVKQPPAIWLNFGIAGHRTLKIGEPLIAQSVHDVETGRVHYPFFLTKPMVKTAPLQTGSRPIALYDEETMYDMEGSGFFSMAARISSPEKISLFKIISDNQENPHANITKTQAQNAIVQNIAKFQNWLEANLAKSGALQNPTFSSAQIFSKWNFTHSERREIENFLNKIAVLLVGHDQECFYKQLKMLTNKREVMPFLKRFHLSTLKKNISL